MTKIKTNILINEDCIKAMSKMPEQSVDMIFADPPYNLQLGEGLTRPNNSVVNGVNDDWDKFDTFSEYDNFSQQWLVQAKRILKPNGKPWFDLNRI